jgi:alpha-amylase/alpha-mannosidase (GH57 family)
MPHTYICFVWHMHQPFYKDLVTGEYQLPWTRMHALKDYYGMVKVLEGFPDVHQTFNLVPSMMVQIEDYAAGTAEDPFLRRALKPAEQLTAEDQAFILKYFFQANTGRMIYRYPRYAELYEKWVATGGDGARARRTFDAQSMRDLQVLSQLAWFDEEFLANDTDVKLLAAKRRGYTLDDQALMGRKQQEICGKVIPVYRESAARGQIEISITPYYHPILPLLCDSNIASVSHPGVALPRRFTYPQDAEEQIRRAREYAKENLGAAPPGMWPSEGSVSDQTLTIAADQGVKWMATDNGVLGATLGRIAGVAETYRPYVWKNNGREMRMIFRDHYLSDLIGFVYSRMEPEHAANHFLDRIRDNCRPLINSGQDVLVPVILDGENAWEHFHESGRDFLRRLYSKISADPGVSAVTVSEALAKFKPEEIQRIHPGSWINANYDIWIGAEEDNAAWNLLLDARETYERVAKSEAGLKIDAARLKMAFEELLIAEGSDWNWWYGPEHHSDNREEFDKLFRDHVAQVYRLLNLAPPEALSRPILRVAVAAFHQPPTGLISPKIEGDVTSYFEWLGAGVYRPDQRQGAMHGKEFIAKELHYGSDGSALFLRLVFDQPGRGTLAGTEIRLAFEGTGKDMQLVAMLTSEGVVLTGNGDSAGRVSAAYGRLFEMSCDLEGSGFDADQPFRLQLSIWRDGLPLDALPAQGWIEFVPAQPSD